ncbi:MAG: phage holin family protein [bacterium]|nr:phage holin family protein [bacterium]
MTPPETPDAPTATPTTGAGSDTRTIGQLVSTISGQFSGLVRGELELAQANLKEKVAKLGSGGAMLAVAGVLALYMLGMLLAAGAWAFSLIMPIWAGFLIMAGILLLFILVLVLFGLRAMKKSKEFEVAPGEGIKKSVEAAKMGFKK